MTTYIPWKNDGAMNGAAAIEDVFCQDNGVKYRLRRAFDGYGSCDQCNGDLAETDGWFSIATNDPADIRRFFDPDGQNGWDVWGEYFRIVGLNDVEFPADYLEDEHKEQIVSTLVADGCDLELSRETVGNHYHWIDDLTYTDDEGTVYMFCCPSCAEKFRESHPDIRIRKVTNHA